VRHLDARLVDTATVDQLTDLAGHVSPRPDVDTASAGTGVAIGVLVGAEGGGPLGVAELLAASGALVEVNQSCASSCSGEAGARPSSRAATLGWSTERPVSRELDRITRAERGRGGTEAADLVDALGAVTAAIGPLGVEKEPTGSAAP
jgi:hypothetical protein